MPILKSWSNGLIALVFAFPVGFASISQGLQAQSAATKAMDSQYPEHWWQPVEIFSAKSWEILPQAGQPGRSVILSKRHELGVFSNFSHSPFVLDGKSYESVEGFWQMMKFPEEFLMENGKKIKDPRAEWVKKYNLPTRQAVSQMVGLDAKRAAKKVSELMKMHSINWVSYRGSKFPYRVMKKGQHYKLIEKAMRKKMESHPEIKELLIKTSPLVLLPDHNQENPPPAWQYNVMWMQMREQLLGH